MGEPFTFEAEIGREWRTSYDHFTRRTVSRLNRRGRRTIVGDVFIGAGRLSRKVLLPGRYRVTFEPIEEPTP